ncbi:hypothetical protein BU26DRAFT_229048 [Trematosphaeria pertusa]|uniref:Uncharacterized protein n=1 Tax=Trematosphaeria pertusa TaxID=390896 RepID=A0A6A6IV17_9PLEO|nr:uncharacterized protein BU26DRAFT_229048 [Trematosphaeria pertusa]KAF2253732.1 hypothetical protein BU26DRAFT_229048 [Trematosphaeria pertusa]
MSFIMWGGHVVDTLRGYLVETIVYLYLLSIIPLHENPLKPVREPIHEPALHFKPIWEVLQSPISSLHAVLDELRDVARDPSGQLKMLLEAAREEKSPVKPLADALENAVE